MDDGGPTKRPRRAGWLERGAWLAAVLLLGTAAAGYAHRHLAAAGDTRAFLAAAAATHTAQTTVTPSPPTSRIGAGLAATRLPSVEEPVDFSLWSESRIARYHRAVAEDSRLPMALLRIPELELEVPVLAGVDELTLNRGAGHIPGTAAPDGAGNIGIAGHRDGFFRPLHAIEVGTLVELVTLAEVRQFRVADVSIVDPTEVGVLADTARTTLTLVTCYPFWFVGSAPQRYIVRAELEDAGGEG